MPHSNHRQKFIGNEIIQSFIHAPYSLRIIFRIGIIALSQVGHGKAVSSFFERHDQTGIIDVTLRCSPHSAAHINTHLLEQWAGSLKTCRRIMIPGNDDNLQFGIFVRYFAQECIVHLLRVGRRIRTIEDIARDQQDIGLPGLQHVLEPCQKTRVFAPAVVFKKMLSEVPVCGVNDPNLPLPAHFSTRMRASTAMIPFSVASSGLRSSSLISVAKRSKVERRTINSAN